MKKRFTKYPSNYVRANSDYPNARNGVKFDVSYTTTDGREVTGQIYTADAVSQRLMDILKWGGTNITVKEYAQQPLNNQPNAKNLFNKMIKTIDAYDMSDKKMVVDSEVEITLNDDDELWLCDYSESRGSAEFVEKLCDADDVDLDKVRKMCDRFGWAYSF